MRHHYCSAATCARRSLVATYRGNVVATWPFHPSASVIPPFHYISWALSSFSRTKATGTALREATGWLVLAYSDLPTRIHRTTACLLTHHHHPFAATINRATATSLHSAPVNSIYQPYHAHTVYVRGTRLSMGGRKDTQNRPNSLNRTAHTSRDVVLPSSGVRARPSSRLNARTRRTGGQLRYAHLSHHAAHCAPLRTNPGWDMGRTLNNILLPYRRTPRTRGRATNVHPVALLIARLFS